MWLLHQHTSSFWRLLYICIIFAHGQQTHDITGNPDAVARAKQLIMDKVAEGNVHDRLFLLLCVCECVWQELDGEGSGQTAYIGSEVLDSCKRCTGNALDAFLEWLPNGSVMLERRLTLFFPFIFASRNFYLLLYVHVYRPIVGVTVDDMATADIAAGKFSTSTSVKRELILL